MLDVRPREEYRAAHISGAVSVPLKELNSRFSKLPRGNKIVAYCHGPYCALAVDAVQLLKAKGFHLVRLGDGVPEACTGVSGCGRGRTEMSFTRPNSRRGILRPALLLGGQTTGIFMVLAERE